MRRVMQPPRLRAQAVNGAAGREKLRSWLVIDGELSSAVKNYASASERYCDLDLETHHLEN